MPKDRGVGALLVGPRHPAHAGCHEQQDLGLGGRRRLQQARHRGRIRGGDGAQHVLERVVVVHAAGRSRDVAQHRVELEFVHIAAGRVRARDGFFALRSCAASPRGAVEQFGQLVEGDRMRVVEGPGRHPILQNGGQSGVAGPPGRQLGDGQVDRVTRVARLPCGRLRESALRPRGGTEALHGIGALAGRAAAVEPQIGQTPCARNEFIVLGIRVRHQESAPVQVVGELCSPPRTAPTTSPVPGSVLRAPGADSRSGRSVSPHPADRAAPHRPEWSGR